MLKPGRPGSKKNFRGAHLEIKDSYSMIVAGKKE